MVCVPEATTRATNVPVAQVIDVLGNESSCALRIKLFQSLINISS
jgi:hypothetical protein